MNKKTKYIFLDIDGTLSVFGKGIPDSAKKAVALARKNGHKIFICSGRARCEMEESILSVGVDGIIGSAGAYVELDGKVIFHKPMSLEHKRQLLSYLNEKQLPLMIETNDELLFNDSCFEAMRMEVDEVKAKGGTFDMSLIDIALPISKYASIDEVLVNKVIYMRAPFELSDIRKDLEEDFSIVECSVPLDGTSGEITEKGMHKGIGIDAVIRSVGIDVKDTIAIGDGENDIEMFQAAGIGIAMGNAKQMIKDIADDVTTDIEEDGIYNAFKKYGLLG